MFVLLQDNSYGGRKEKRKRFEGAEEGSRGPLDSRSDEPMPFPNPMVGFNLPNQKLRSVDRCLPLSVHSDRSVSI